MADPFGAIIVGFTDDFIGNKPAIAEVLTGLQLWQGKAEFACDGINISAVAHSRVRQPTLTPYRDKIVSLIVDGKEVHKHINDLSRDELDDICNVVEREMIPPSEIAAELAVHIEQGSLSLSCSAHDGQRSQYTTVLTVDADGDARLLLIYHATGRRAIVVEYGDEPYAD